MRSTGNFYDIVRNLVDFSAPPDAQVLSLYLDISQGKEKEALAFAREECGLLLDLEEEAAPGSLEEMVKEVLSSLAGEIEEARAEEYDGLAFFLCAAPPLHQRIRLRFPFQNQAQVGRDPFLRQLLFYTEEYEQAVCVTLGDGTISLCEVHVGDISRTREILPTHGRSPGEELNAVLSRLLREDPRLHVILLGEEKRRREIEPLLSQTVLGRVIDRIDEPLVPQSPRFLPAIHRSLQAYERRSEEEGVARLLPSRAEEGAVAVGLKETLDALNRGTVQTLYILQDFSGTGWLCDACFYLGLPPAPPLCLACGASVSEVPLEEHVLDQAAALGAEIETVFSSEALAKIGGVGALLHDVPRSPRGNTV